MDIGAPLIGGTLHAVVGFLVALVALPVARAAAPWLGLVDSQARDRAGQPVPRSGGVAIALGWAAACLLVGGDDLGILAVLGLGAFAIGLHDDLVKSSPRLRLALLALLAVGAAVAGFRVDSVLLPGIGSVPLGVLAIPLSAAWILGATVAFDVIDGLDGLASALVVVAGLGLMLTGGGGVGGAAAGALVGACAALLFFNLPPASIYMGDNGSNLVGFVVGATSLVALDSGGSFLLLPGLLLIAVPIVDAAIAVARRATRGDLFGSDQEHLHHRLLRSGRPPIQALALMLIVATACATIAVVMAHVDAATVLLPIAGAALGWLAWEARVRR
jgi:UDP-GlcNAc:undecaprenyl-phosphate/decaprenyl-phosphate GlcNAc-1-phosphate transferase